MSGSRRCKQLWIACLLLIVPWQLLAVELLETPRWRRFGVAEGLPSRMVLALAQDRQGYVWAATDDGLARYDGRQMRVWQHDPADARSLPGNAVEALLVDPHDRIWVGINGAGLSLLGPDREGFTHQTRVASTCDEEVWALAYARDTLWVGTSGAGICRLHEDGSVSVLRAEAGNTRGLPDDIVFSMVADADGHVWVGTGAGLARWNGRDFEQIAPDVLGQRSVIRLTLDPDGGVWAGTDEGLFRVDGRGRVLDTAWPQAQGLRATVALHDRNGGYWLGSSAGLYRGNAQHVALLQGNWGGGFLTADTAVLDVLQDHEGGIWIALLTQGLAYLPPDWRRFSTYYQLGDKSLESRYLLNSSADGNGFLISGAEDLYQLGADGQLRTLLDKATLGPQAVWSSLRHANGDLWLGRVGRVSVLASGHRGVLRDVMLGTGGDPQHRVDILRAAPDGTVWLSIVNYGLQQRAPDGRLLRELRRGGEEGLPESLVEQLLFTPTGELYVATGAGLWVWAEGGLSPVPGVAPGSVFDLSFQTDGSVWLARMGALEHYRVEAANWVLTRRLDQEHGVPAVAIGGLISGSTGQVWATTPRGLLAWHAAQQRLHLYGERDGLSDVEFTSRPPVRDATGKGLAVSATGLVTFDPDSPAVERVVPRLAIDAVALRRDGDAAWVTLPTDKAVELAPGDQDLRVAARLLSYADPQQHRYRFWVQGLEEVWVEQGNQADRTLSGLAPRHYVVNVQAAVADGPWSVPAQIHVTVIPPWWRTPAAYAMYAVVAALLVGVLLWAYRRRVQRRSQRQLEQQQRRLMEQALQAKTTFLATLGHEVRTPMTGVLGMSELLLASQLDDTQRRYVNAIAGAGNHLLRLVNETLDLARIEAGRLELDSKPFELATLVEEVRQLMQPLAHKRRLTLEIVLPEYPVTVVGDALRLRQILLNLVGNAIKFTERGRVELKAEALEQGHVLRLCVTDTGPGIAPTQQERLFQRFEQVDGVRTQARYGGSGLGLAISKELVHAMSGSIGVESADGHGACFIVELPLAWWISPAAQEGTEASSSMRPLHILLVEDDATVAEVITALLSARGHTIVHAPHGLAGLSSVATETFDLGVFDLDLPALDGLALASQLRGLGYGFPLIAVTARADMQAESLARGAGFAGFLRKPVSGDMLGAAIAQVWREHLARESAQ